MKIKICNATIQPGEIASLALPMPDLYSCAPLYMPIKVINGVKEGSCVLIFSNLEGHEMNGMEIVNRIIQRIKPQELSGTIIAVPVVNVYGMTHYPMSLPIENDLTNCFPGKEDGTYGERIAHIFTEELLKKADYCIELETGGLNHDILPQIYCNFDNQKTKKLAKEFQAPVITNVELGENNLRQTTEDLQIPLLVYQAGEAMRFDEDAIILGVNGIENVLKAIDMLNAKPEHNIEPIFSKEEDWIVAHNGGILYSKVSLGQKIDKNEVIGHICDPFGDDRQIKIKSPISGVIVGINTTPIIHEGMPIFKIASFLDAEKAEHAIEEWELQQESDNG